MMRQSTILTDVDAGQRMVGTEWAVGNAEGNAEGGWIGGEGEAPGPDG